MSSAEKTRIILSSQETSQVMAYVASQIQNCVEGKIKNKAIFHILTLPRAIEGKSGPICMTKKQATTCKAIVSGTYVLPIE